MMYLAIAGITSTLMFPACLEIKTATRVNSDGSLVRTVTFTGDSSSVEREPLPLTIDTTWSVSRETIDERKFRLTATKAFADVESLNEILVGERGKRVHVTVKLDQTFWWFFTEHRYTETYHAVSVFDLIPYTDYVTPEELTSLLDHEAAKDAPLSGQDSVSLSDIENRLEMWYLHTVFESYYQAFLDGVRDLNDPSLTPARVGQKKNDLFRESGKKIEAGDYEHLEPIFERVLKDRSVRKAFASARAGMKTFKENLEFQDRILQDSYEVSVEMPGLITNTNAASIAGTVVRWSDFILRAYVTDYAMWVSSRTVNWWAVIVTGIVLLVGATGLILAALRRRGSV